MLSSTAGLWKSITSPSQETGPDWIAKRTQFWLARSCLRADPLGNSPTLRYKDFTHILSTWYRIHKHVLSLFREHFYCTYSFASPLRPALGTSSFIHVVRIILDSVNPAPLLDMAQKHLKVCWRPLILLFLRLLPPSACLLFKSTGNSVYSFSVSSELPG